MFKAEFVETTNKKKPFLEFIDTLTDDEQAEIFAAIDKLCDMKNLNVVIPQKLSKFIGEGIYELRVNHRNKISRSLYFYLKDKRIVFTNGFIKKSERTPKNEIEKAIKLKKEYQLYKDK